MDTARPGGERTITVDDVACRPMRKDAARNRAALVSAARSVFAERGLEASLDDVARQAGVGVGTAYRHFANKYELADAAFKQSMDEIIELVEDAAAMDDPWAGIVAVIEGIAGVQTVDRGLRELLSCGHEQAKTEQINDRLVRPLGVLVERARLAGVVRADLESTDLGLVLIILCHVSDMTAGVAPELWRRYLPMLLAGLRPGEQLPAPAIGSDDLRAAMVAQTQRLLRMRRDVPC